MCGEHNSVGTADTIAAVEGVTNPVDKIRIVRAVRARRASPVGKVDIAVVVDVTRKENMPNVVGKLRARRDNAPVGTRDTVAAVVEAGVTARSHVPRTVVVVALEEVRDRRS